MFSYYIQSETCAATQMSDELERVWIICFSSFTYYFYVLENGLSKILDTDTRTQGPYEVYGTLSLQFL